MRIVYVTMQFPEPSEAFAWTEIATLRNLGVDVSVVALRPRPRDFARRMELLPETLSGLPIWHAPRAALLREWGPQSGRLISTLAKHQSLWRLGGLRNLIVTPFAVAAFRRVQAANPDVVHLFWGHYPALVGHLIREENPETILSQFLGSYDLEVEYRPGLALARMADVVWTHAEANLPSLRSFSIPEERVEVVRRGIQIPSSSFDIPRTGCSIIAAGRLVAKKGFDRAIRVFSRVRAQMPDARLVIAGNGPERRRLEQLTKKMGLASEVTFAGHLPQVQLFKLLSEANVLLCLSSWPGERLPNVVKEALVRGCPVVTTPTIGIEELIIDGRGGFVVGIEAEEEAVARVVELLEGKERTSEIARRGADHVRAHFDVEKNMRSYVNAWERLAAERRRRSRFHSRDTKRT